MTSRLGARSKQRLARIQQTHRVVPCDSPQVAEVFDAFRSRLRLRVPEIRALTVERTGLNAAALADGAVVLWAGLVEAVDDGGVPQDEFAGLVLPPPHRRASSCTLRALAVAELARDAAFWVGLIGRCSNLGRCRGRLGRE